MLDVSFLSGIDLFKHLPDSCLEALEKDSNVLDCSESRHLTMWSASKRFHAIIRRKTHGN